MESMAVKNTLLLDEDEQLANISKTIKNMAFLYIQTSDNFMGIWEIEDFVYSLVARRNNEHFHQAQGDFTLS